MPVIFQPSSHVIKLRGVLHRIPELIQNRPFGICLQGKSIQELEDRIEEFKDAYICWGAMNRFDIYQKFILDKIGKKLDIVMDVGEVQYAEDFERQLRIPRWKTFLANPTSLLITSEEILENITKLGWSVEAEHPNQLVIVEECRKISVPNSIMLYLMILAKLEVKRIVLFGFDGFGNPKAFKDTPVWDASELAYDHEDRSILSYYKQEYVLEQRKTGFRDTQTCHLSSDGPTMNDQFWPTYSLYCKENSIQTPEIINCSARSLFTIFKKVDYALVKGELR